MTDQGFLQEEALVWESLHNVEGDGNFCDSDFRLCHPPQRAPPTTLPLSPSTQQQQQQIDQVRGQRAQGVQGLEGRGVGVQGVEG